MNSGRSLHLSTTARRNSPDSNSFSQAKAKTVTGREEWRGVRDGDAHEKQMRAPESPRKSGENPSTVLAHVALNERFLSPSMVVLLMIGGKVSGHLPNGSEKLEI